MAKKFDLEHIDMGKFLREVAKMDTPLGREVYDIQNVTKTLVPARILEEIFTIKLNDIPQEKGVVFDGFPRNMDQAEYFEKAMKEFGRKVDVVVFIKLSKDESLKRISKRWVCKKCKSVWIMGKDVKNAEDKCPSCGENIMQRIDDIEEGVKMRLEVFENETIPVIKHFYSEKKVVEIDGVQTIEKVSDDILEKLNDYN